MAKLVFFLFFQCINNLLHIPIFLGAILVIAVVNFFDFKDFSLTRCLFCRALLGEIEEIEE